MRRAIRVQTVCGAALSAFALLAAGVAHAQDAKPSAKAAAKAAGAAAAGAPAAPTGGSGDGALKSRVDNLEEQLVDMQVVVGTLESMARSGGSAGAAPAFKNTPATAGADSSRVEALEGQVRTLQGQIQQLQDQIRAMGGQPRTAMAASQAAAAVPAAPAAAAPAFGSTTITPNSDAIGGIIANDGGAAPAAPPVPAPPGSAAAQSSVTTAALPPPGDGATPKQLYETAYGYLLQKDYGAAEVAFGDFLKRFPGDALAGNAQYWLGESHFVRGEYKAAAGAFLKGYQQYAQSAKAPDSLLKLAMSLDRLGQKDAACSSYAELSTKFPSAPASVKSRAQSERQRVGCP